MNKFGSVIVLLLASFFIFPAIALGAVSYERTPAGFEITSPVTLNVSFDDFLSDTGLTTDVNYWGIVFTPTDSSENFIQSSCVPSSTLSLGNSIDFPSSEYDSVVFSGFLNTPCDVNVEWPVSGAYLEGDSSYVVFTVIGERINSSGGNTFVYNPEIELLTNLSSKTFRGVLPIKHKVTDKNDSFGQPEYGLRSRPVAIYYAVASSSAWIPLSLERPAAGTYNWDTSNLPDGPYKLKLTASGNDNGFNQVITDSFFLDNTPPFFDLDIDPDFTKGVPVDLYIESSEVLKNAPNVTVSQLNHEPVVVELVTDIVGRKYRGQYKIVSDFDGPAIVSIRGEDLVGNLGENILSGSEFAVGINPPPSPVVDPLPPETLTTTTLITISGQGINSDKVLVRVNNSTSSEYTQNNLRNGKFGIKDIQLNSNFNKGRNFINVISYDKSDRPSFPTTFKVFIDRAPEVSFVEPRGRLLKLNGSIKFSWKSYDFNDDALTYGVEISGDGGESWRVLAENLKETQFVWDSTSVPDSSNYLVKISVYDGNLYSQVVSNKITIQNNLPTITLDLAGDFYTSKDSKVLTGFVRSKNDLLKKLEISKDSGKSWEEILPDDGKWNSTFERFNFALSSLSGGPQKIILSGRTVSGKVVVNAQNLKVFFDNIAPSITAKNLADKVYTKNILALGGVATDDFSGIKSVQYSVDESDWYEATILNGFYSARAEFKINHPSNIGDGKHVIRIRSVDRAGNLSKIKLENIVVDATPPRIGSFLLEQNGAIVLPDKDGFFEVGVGDSEFRVSIALNPKTVRVLLNDEQIELVLDLEDNLWKSKIGIDKTGLIPLEIITKDEHGNKSEKELLKMKVVAEDKNGLSVKSKWSDFFRKLFKK